MLKNLSTEYNEAVDKKAKILCGQLSNRCTTCRRFQQCAKLQSTLERDLETGDYLKVTRLSHGSAEKTHVKSKQRHLSKLELLMKRKQKQPELRPEGHDRWVVNLTERNLTPSQNEVLRMGLRTSSHQVSPAGHHRQCGGGDQETTEG